MAMERSLCPKPCPPSKPFCELSICSSSCLFGDLQYNDTSCISLDACKKLGWKQYGKRCIQECPKGTYELYGLLTDDVMVCDAMIPSIVTSAVSFGIIILSCLLFRYQLTTKQPEDKHEPRIRELECGNGHSSLLDSDQTQVMDIWTQQEGLSSARNRDPTSGDAAITGRHLHATSRESPSTSLLGRDVDDDSLLDVRTEHVFSRRTDKTHGGREAYSANTQQNRELDDDSLLDVRTAPATGGGHSACPYFSDEDDMSSVPTVVQLKGFQEDSMDISEPSMSTDGECKAASNYP